ncbi:MAG: hypothetical protein HYW25_04525 [Candidatus Aenigmarchaeota archaeon]|nr:hypothetical protein [Candidatus Aenigmarchaeota archaeon]
MAVIGFRFALYIKTDMVPYRHLRNVIYFLFPDISEERALFRRKRLAERYGLPEERIEGHIEIYSRSRFDSAQKREGNGSNLFKRG